MYKINSDLNDTSDIRILSFDSAKDQQTRKHKYKIDKYKENYKNFYSTIEYKTQLLNIDSKYRNKIPKNIYKTSNITLPKNPIYITKDSKVIKINCPNHKFSINDNIIIHNVISNPKILANCIYFFNNFSYFFINYDNHSIPIDFANYNNECKISIEIITTSKSTLYGNIPVNLITQIYIYYA